MIWLLLCALAGWTIYQSSRISQLERRQDKLRLDLEGLRAAAKETIAADQVVIPPAIEISPSLAATAHETPIAPAAIESTASEAPQSEPAAEPPPPRPRKPPINIAAWLSEHGLAWLGGGALALGGVFLVTYAVQRGVFTPQLRVAAAGALGALMLLASEVLRRRDRQAALVSALAAGAGAATLYAAVWASEQLYHFIGLGAAAPMLAAISALLFALGWVHGAPLALLALGGAFLVPAITGRGDWSDGPLTLYLVLIVATGYAVAGARRWGSVGLTAGLGAAGWALAQVGHAKEVTTVLLAVLPATMALAAREWESRKVSRPAGMRVAGSFGVMLPAALVAGGLILPPLWFGARSGSTSIDVAPVLASCALILIAAAAAARRRTAPPFQIIGYASALLAVLIATFGPHAHSTGLVLGTMAVALASTLGGLCAAAFETDPKSRRWAGAGAATAALAFGLADVALRQAHPPGSWLPLAAGSLVLAAATALLGRRSAAPQADLSLALWIWATMAVAMQGLAQSLSPYALPPALAAAALAAAALQVRPGWRGFGGASLAAVVAAFAALLSPDIAGTALDGRGEIWLLVASGAASAALVAAAARLVGRSAPRRDLGEALSAGAILLGLTALFLILSRIAAPASGAGLDRFTEAALRTLLLLATGLFSRSNAQSGVVSRWRPHVLLVLGALHAVLWCGLGMNPLWSGRPVLGAPLADGLALAFLAPALMLAAATRRAVSPERRLARGYALAAVVLGGTWAALEIRRLCQGANLSIGLPPFSPVEAAADALALLIMACGLSALYLRSIQRAAPGLTATAAPRSSISVVAALAIAVADLAYLHLASPWWGPINSPLASYGAAAVLGLCYIGGVAASLVLDRLLAASIAVSRFARISATLQLFVLVTLATRLSFRGLDMAPASAGARIETWAFSAIWALYGLGVLVFGVRRRDTALRWTGLSLLLFTTAKVLLFDTAHLDGVVRAASFLALGVLLILGALAARRMGALGLGGGEDEA